MKLIQIPKEKYDEYRLTLMFESYKWDPQFLDNNTIAKHVLILSQEEYEELKQLTEAIDKETRAAEEFLNNHLEHTKLLKLPKKLHKKIKLMKNYNKDEHVRLMRYDFHPIKDGQWAVSEVNSDVPGGFAEVMPWEDTIMAINELGTMIDDIQKQGDYAVEKWSK